MAQAMTLCSTKTNQDTDSHILLCCINKVCELDNAASPCHPLPDSLPPSPQFYIMFSPSCTSVWQRSSRPFCGWGGMFHSVSQISELPRMMSPLPPFLYNIIRKQCFALFGHDFVLMNDNCFCFVLLQDYVSKINPSQDQRMSFPIV